MRSINLKEMLDRCTAHPCPIHDAIEGAVRQGVVVVDLLEPALLKAGYVISDDPDEHAEHGFRKFSNLVRVLVHDPSGAVVAMGASGDREDALLHACLGYLREYAEAVEKGGEHANPGIAAAAQEHSLKTK